MKSIFFKKQTSSTILTLLLSLTILISIAVPVKAIDVNGFFYTPGDILITKSTLANGLTGHAGIVHPDGKNVIHIAGPGEKPNIISISSWLREYPSTKVIRYKYKVKSTKAANWARDYYINGAGKNTNYRITFNPKDRSYVYCSELVWQAYYYGADVTFKIPYISSQGIITSYLIPNIITPYDFINPHGQSYNGFRTVKTIKW